MNFSNTFVVYTHPQQRAESIGIFRLWRDLGYAIGAILTGVIADHWGLLAPVMVIGTLTLISALIVKVRMRCAAETQKTYPSTSTISNPITSQHSLHYSLAY